MTASVADRFHAERFGLTLVELPFALGRFGLHAIAPGAALQDAGLAWLIGEIERSALEHATPDAATSQTPPARRATRRPVRVRSPA